jgi:hypothetical protein
MFLSSYKRDFEACHSAVTLLTHLKCNGTFLLVHLYFGSSKNSEEELVQLRNIFYRTAYQIDSIGNFNFVSFTPLEIKIIEIEKKFTKLSSNRFKYFITQVIPYWLTQMVFGVGDGVFSTYGERNL